jgi:hypothetical protein
MHKIHGYIADYDMLTNATYGFGFKKAVVVRLKSNNLGFLPITYAFSKEMYHNKINKSRMLKTRRLGFPIALIETNYFGGIGEQSARVVHGQETPLKKGKINQALKILGVLRTSEIDEFDVVGLGKYRTNDDWVSKCHLQNQSQIV